MMNNVKTAVLLAAMGALCMGIGAFWGSTGLWIGTFIGLAMVGGSYWFSDKLAIASARATEVTAQEMPQYHAVVAELCQRMSIPMPRLYVSDNPQPNAFATGRNPHHAAVCVTRGLLDNLDWQEIQGVLAHEISHVRNRDITGAARMAMFAGMFGGGGRNDDRDGNGLAGLMMIILAPIAAAMIQMAISRSREFEADASAARLRTCRTATP